MTSALLGADPYRTLDLLDGVGFTRYYGSTGLGSAGVPVCGGYDCDGDGRKDLAFGQFQADPFGNSNAGQVTFILGNGTIGGEFDSAGFPSNMVKFAGGEVMEVTGSEVWMGDVNGDGLGDLLIARQAYDPGGRVGAGALTIVFGDPILRTWAAGGALIPLSDLPEDRGLGVLTIVGDVDERVGIWMRTGDVNGDGIADIILGADQRDDHSGGVYVILGGPELVSLGETLDLADFGEGTFPESMQSRVALVRAPETSPHFHLGATVNVGDLDGNGRAEVILAAALNRAGAALGPAGVHASGGAVFGRMYVCWDENFPDGPWPNGYTFRIDEPLLGDFTQITGTTGNRAFGEELLAGEDYSGDGFPDLFVGDLVAQADGLFNAGLGYVFYNAAGLRGRVFTMASPPAEVAYSLIKGPVAGAISSDTVAHGDFDADGVVDLAIGNPHDNPKGRTEAGSMHILYGQPGGWPAIIDLKPTQLPAHEAMRVVEVVGAYAGDVLCYSGAASDMDGDGYVDLIVNEMTGNGFGGTPIDVGNVIIVSGEALGEGPVPQLVVHPQADLMETVHGVDYGLVNLGDTLVIDLLVTHATIEDAPITWTTMPIIAGPQQAAFTIVSTSDYAIGTSLVRVRFHPGTVGPHGAALVMQSAEDVLPVRYGLTGIGVDPRLACDLDFVTIGGERFLQLQTAFGVPIEVRTSLLLDTWTAWWGPETGTGGPVLLPVPEAMTMEGRYFYQAWLPEP